MHCEENIQLFSVYCGTGHTSVDIDASANLQLMDKFCYLGDMFTVNGEEMQLWIPKSKLDGINSGSWYNYLPIGIYQWLGGQAFVYEVVSENI